MVQTPCSFSSITGITVSYLVIEEGVYTVGTHGVNAEAFKTTPSVTDHLGSWVGTAKSYSNSYTSPVVLGQVMSQNDPDWSQFWCHGATATDPPSASDLAVGKHVGEDPDTTRVDEELGYLVIEAGSGILGGLQYVADVGPDIIVGPDDGPPGQYVFSPAFTSAPSVIASQVAMDGGDGGWAVVASVGSSSVDLVIEEDQCLDGERSHSTEQVAFIAFGEISTTPVSPNLRTGTVICGNESWETVSLDHTYASMVVIASAEYEAAGTPAVVRVQNATGNSFQVRVQTPCSITPLNGITVNYLTIEEGVFTAASDGVTAEAVKTTSSVTDHSGSWVGTGRSYSNSYTSPVVLGQVMSQDDPDWSQFWCYGVAPSEPPSDFSLAVGKHVGEDPDTTRVDETLGYLVVEAGTGSIEGLQYVAGVGPDTVMGPDDGTPAEYNLGVSPVPGAPVLVNQAAMDGLEGGWAVVTSRGPNSVALVIEEDQCADAEGFHTTEQVGYLAFAELSPLIFVDGFETGDASRWN